ncbi:hypothetical protein BofuT4_P145640.1 [Botrytis cinerea T4]|uniref:Uncharacterized protein n=1 Tax=Botryotinia fuckeliana (strain T4) TaxID=999810 RepID=G2YXP7_BOTF4|nr:hypothetical protein BofuT4_P145640.1 [Botrytis cinerea T4]
MARSSTYNHLLRTVLRTIKAAHRLSGSRKHLKPEKFKVQSAAETLKDFPLLFNNIDVVEGSGGLMKLKERQSIVNEVSAEQLSSTTVISVAEQHEFEPLWQVQ